MGILICIDALLVPFTVLPLKLALVAARRPRASAHISVGEVKLALLMASVVALLSWIDASWLYHAIRAQSTLKLYVLFNVCEVMDKLLVSFGLDLLDCVMCGGEDGDAGLLYLPIAALYTFIHAVLLLYQVITLNVAVNSHGNAVLTLLVSNQFMELKSAVFKRFDRDSLFTLATADIVERVQLGVFLCIIFLRNGGEMGLWGYWMSGNWAALQSLCSSSMFWERLLNPIVMVFVSEFIVDAFKHAFIVKSNRFTPHAYRHFRTSLLADLDSTSTSAVARRIGFSSLPLACLGLKFFVKGLNCSHWLFVLNSWLIVMFFKNAIGAILTRLSKRVSKPSVENECSDAIGPANETSFTT